MRGRNPLLLACISLTITTQLPAAMAGMETLLVIEPTPEYPRRSEGDIEMLRDGRMALVYTRFQRGADDHSAAEIVWRTLDPQGKNWSEDRVLVANEGRQNVMSPSVLRNAKGELLLFYLRKNDWSDCAMYVRRSRNDFATLSIPIRVTTPDGYFVVNNDRAIQLDSGRLVVPAALHPCPDGRPSSWQSHAIPQIFYSDDNARSWKPGEPAVSAEAAAEVTLQEPGVLALGGDKLWMWIRTDKGSQYQCLSEDGGLHWSRPGPSALQSPLSPATIKQMPWNGQLLCVWNDHSGRHPFKAGNRTPLCWATSADGGRTWSPSQVIEDNPDGWYCYISMTFVDQRVILSYCAGDRKVGQLNRLKVVSLTSDMLTGPTAAPSAAPETAAPVNR